MENPIQDILKEKLDILFRNAIRESVFPCASVWISYRFHSKKQKLLLHYGSVNNRSIDSCVFFDLASLTKPLATTLAVLCLIKEKKIGFNDTLISLLKSTIPNDKIEITLDQLLNHSSGLAAHKPFFKELRGFTPNNNKKILSRILQELLQNKPGEKQEYSDLGFILLGIIVETQSGLPLNEFVEEKVLGPLNLNRELFFLKGNKRDKNKRFAPTEQCSWRNKHLCGQVHDDNTYAVGGVSGQAGLFGNINGVASLVEFLIEILQEKKEHPFFKRKDLQQAVIRKSDIGSWGLGFDTPSSYGSSSGRYFSKNSFGHLGFTGTSFWVDMEKEVSIVLLTNRVNPDRDNIKIRKFRPVFHDIIMKILE